jgi:isovaleryl-CoA dehydrogenase
MWFFSDEHRMIQETARQFAKSELAPKAEELDQKEEFNDSAFRKMGELGLLGITVPTEYEGSGLDTVASTIVMEEFGRACASTALSYLAHSILFVHNLKEHGTEEQKKKYLPKTCSGEWISGMAMTEPGAGSDSISMQTRAEKKGDKYILNGSKIWITNSTQGDVFFVYAKTPTDDNPNALSSFIIEKTFSGFKAGKKFSKMGMRASPTGELHFENCEVPAENLVGGTEGVALKKMLKNLEIERVTIAGISNGIALQAIDDMTKYATERKQFGQEIGQFQMVQQKIADAVALTMAARELTFSGAKRIDLEPETRLDDVAAAAKLISAQNATKVALDAIQTLGGYGYSREFPVERYARDAKLNEIGAGTNEVLRIILAKKELKRWQDR